MNKIGSFLIRSAILFATTFLILPFLITDNWFVELISHLRVQVSIGLFILFIGSLIFSINSTWRISAFLLCIIGLTLSSNIFDASPIYKLNEGSFNLMTINLYSSNQNFDALKERIETKDPLVLFFQEYNQFWHDRLNTLDDYRFRKYVIQEGNFGIATYSKIPFEKEEVLYFSEKRFPSISTNLNIDGSNIEFLNVHLEPPGHPESHEMRKIYLNNLYNHTAKIREPLIIAGDFNATHFSPLFKNFIRKSNLNIHKENAYNDPTWPSGLGLFGICIDHVLCSKELEICGKQTLDSWGSDHLPVYVEICESKN